MVKRTLTLVGLLGLGACTTRHSDAMSTGNAQTADAGSVVHLPMVSAPSLALPPEVNIAIDLPTQGMILHRGLFVRGRVRGDARAQGTTLWINYGPEAGEPLTDCPIVFELQYDPQTNQTTYRCSTTMWFSPGAQIRARAHVTYQGDPTEYTDDVVFTYEEDEIPLP